MSEPVEAWPRVSGDMCVSDCHCVILNLGSLHYTGQQPGGTMCEGPSRISGPIPPDPTLFPEFYRRPASARGRLEGNDLKLTFLSGPLAPDPSLHPGCYSARPPPPPRVHPNAMHILERGQRGVVGNLLQLEGVSLHPDPPKHKKEPRDHGKENVRRLREIQRRCREREAEKEGARPVPVKALWRSPKYEAVPSKVMTQLQETTPPKRSECQNFLKAHSRCGSAGAPRRSPSPGPPTLDADAEMQVRGRAVDFVRHNARAATQACLRRSRSLQALNQTLEQQRKEREEYDSHQRGHVPQYLQERKEKWRREAEERRRNAPDPSVPLGHTQLPEKERQETLDSLKQTQRSLVKELLSLPVRADTLSVQTRRTELDRKLSEVEEAIKIFSRPKVYIRVDT
uniref:Enkurin domain containing 1 n=1 Tax=Lepisosteus oculatus TaxID=7918 RepID=W5NF17_LEPOC|nr:PREDICTED: enkurin domain-containing protein 1 [Lepisosteus oculatus]